MAEAAFSLEISNLSSVPQNLRLRSVKFDTLGLIYRFVSSSSVMNFSQHEARTVRIEEKSLFFDTLIAMPFDSETTRLSLDFGVGDREFVVKYDRSQVEKCVFFQRPRIDARQICDRLWTLQTKLFFGDSCSPGEMHMSDPTAAFLILQDLLGRPRIAFDDMVFRPTFGGLYFYYTEKNQMLSGELWPTDVFGKLDELKRSKMIQDYVDFDFADVSEFVLVKFTDHPRISQTYDEKLMRVQYIVAPDTSDLRVRHLTSALADAGFRTYVKQGSFERIIGALLQRDFLDSPTVKQLVDSMHTWVPEINRVLLARKAICLDLGRSSNAVFAELQATLSKVGIVDSRFFRVHAKWHAPIDMDLPTTEAAFVYFMCDYDSINVDIRCLDSRSP
ncbi:MAG: hypothetical protein NT028_11350 [candidate division Zixibacteria bacterium]|nr:hypothetical protein [candidate division Zixibacteria bacterium]